MLRKHNDLCVGIDLGTTNSVIATCFVDKDNGGEVNATVSSIERYVEIIGKDNWRTERGELLPSCVYYYGKKDGEYEPIVGDFARKTFSIKPYAVARSIKKQMGQEKITISDWNKGYPDQTPEEVSARILKHLIKALEDYYDEEIIDAVITIPANFNIAQREATLRAAELAGLEVREGNGKYCDDILLSEPEAVVYDVLNQIQNKKINIPIDFSQSRKIMVFDIGGGTLDITLHDICRQGNYFNIKTLATNRFNMIAGDKFDETLAQLMYMKYVSSYKEQGSDIVQHIQKDYPAVIASLTDYAEKLKVLISNRHKDLARIHKDLTKDSEFDYGGYMPNGYVSDGEITVGEFEECLAPLLGWQYQFEDYKYIKDIQDDQNIIYPILNVLDKAAQKLGTESLKVDAVIMNGGMSRLYLIENRIASFFGFKPITINDPDKSVAQGASVYHYYLHQNDSSNLNRFYRDQKVNKQESGKTASADRTVFEDVTEYQQNQGIRSVSRVQNETIYLGLRGGAVFQLVNSGQELPFESDKITGFSILTGQNRIRIPIKQATLQNGEYQTIAAGEIEFNQKIHSETPVSIRVNISRSGIISIDAWTSHDKQGLQVIEKGTVALNIGDSEAKPLNRARGRAINSPPGTKLIVANELSSFKSLVNRLKKTHQAAPKNKIMDNIRIWKNRVSNAGNPDEFASGMLEMLKNDPSTAIALNILPIARKFSIYWTKQEKEQLSAACLTVLNKELHGFATSDLEVNANIEAIKTIGFCGIIKDCEAMQDLCQQERYKNAFIYAFAYCGLHQEWIYEQLLLDIKYNRSIQDSLWAMGLSMHKFALAVDGLELGELIMKQIDSGRLLQNELNIAVVTLGILCSQIKDNDLAQNEEFCSQVRAAIDNIRQIYEPQQWENTLKARSVANEFIIGEKLSEENEKTLLNLLTK